MGELYIKYEYWVAALQLIFAMLGMGATLTTNDFKGIIKMPKVISLGILVQLLIVPLTALLFITSLSLASGVMVGLALIAAIPGGTTSNIFTYMARGNIPLSISITTLTSLACLISTPLVLSLLVTDFLPNNFAMPTQQIVTDIAFTLLLPLLIGILILQYAPKHAAWVSRWSIRLSLLGIALIVVGSSLAGRIDINAFGVNNIVVVAGFVIALAIVSKICSRALSLRRPDSAAIEMEVVVRNVNLGVLIKASMFPAVTGVDDPIGDAVLFTVLAYGAFQLLFAAALIALNRKAATDK